PRLPAGLARGGGDHPVPQGVRPAGNVHGPRGRGPQPLPAARARLGLRLRESLERGRGLRPLSAREDRPTVRREVDRDRQRRRVPAEEGRLTVDRLPIRVRLTAAFALAMLLVLVAAAVFVYVRQRSALTETIDHGLERRSDDVAAVIHRPRARLHDAAGGRL